MIFRTIHTKYSVNYLGNIEVTDLLLKNGADVDIEDNYEDTAYNWAKSKGNLNTHKYIIIYLNDVHTINLNLFRPWFRVWSGFGKIWKT